MIKKHFVIAYKKGHRFLTSRGIRPYFLRFLNKKLIQYIKSDTVQMNGHTFYLDSVDSLRLSTRGEYESFITELFAKEVKDGDIVVDIGANIGCHTLALAKLVGEKGKVYAFEPHPETFALLKKNIEENKYTNVIAEQKAISDKPGVIKLYLAKKNRTTTHSIVKNQYTQDSFFEVEAVALDDYFKQRNESIVNFIKLDVEGAEHHTMLGMRKLIQRNPLRNISFWDAGNYVSQHIGILNYLIG